MSPIQLSSTDPPAGGSSRGLSGRAVVALTAALGILTTTVPWALCPLWTVPPARAESDPDRCRGEPRHLRHRGDERRRRNGFGGGKIYYPADTSQGSFVAIAVVPGYTATWAAEGAWTGHWLASFGFVVIGIDTLDRNDRDVARGTRLLAALDHLTQRSSVRSRVGPNRLAVMGHSMGGNPRATRRSPATT